MDDGLKEIEFFENQCCVCYTPFWQKRRGRMRRTCSQACRQILYRMRKGERKPPRPKHSQEAAPEPDGKPMPRVPTICAACGGPIAQPARGRKRKTCSDRCRKRLLRRQNPRCLICGKHFRMAKHQKDQKYCSKRCKRQANKLRWQARKRQKAWEEVKHYRPDWMPRQGSGYRVERIPWGEVDDEEEMVTEEREPKPRYEPVYQSEEERLAARAAEWAEDMEKERLANEKAKKARKLAWELLEDDSKWWKW